MNVLVLGCSSGIGYSTLKQLELEGEYAKIYGTCRNKSILLKKLKKDSNIFEARNLFELDLRHDESINDFIKNFKEECKSLQGIVLNAGYLATNNALMASDEEIMEHFKINYFSQIRILKFIIKKYFLRKGDASVVAISSSAVKFANGGRMAYSSSKAAMETSMRVLSREYGRKGIRFNCIAPGIVNTKLMKGTTSLEDIEKWESEVDLRTTGMPDDISKMISFLLSTKSNYLTGQIISMDGGR